MKKLLLAITIATLSTGVMAADKKPTQQEYCAGIAEFAKTAMTVRQNGLPLVKALEFSPIPLTTTILLQAYDISKFSTQEYKLNAITEFQNSWMVGCLQSEYK